MDCKGIRGLFFIHQPSDLPIKVSVYVLRAVEIALNRQINADVSLNLVRTKRNNVLKFANTRKTYYFCIMQIEFDKEYLRELYQTGKTSDKKHRFQPQVIKGYKKAIDVLKVSRRIEDLFPFKGLNFEVLQGDKIGLCSVRANGQYRVEFKVNTIGDEQIITICLIMELSNHYK